MRGEEVAILFVVLIALAISITIAVFYLKNLQDLLKECKGHNRAVEPSNVWLMFIPLFNIIYPFILYPKISESIKKEFEERGAPQAGDYAKNLGLALPILGLCGMIPVVGVLASIGNLVVFIIYWVKTAEFKTKLRAIPAVAAGVSGSEDLLD